MDRSSMTPPAKNRPSTSSSSLASSKAPGTPQPQPPSSMASSSRSVRGATPTGSRANAKAADGDKPTRPSSKDSLKQKMMKKPEEAPKPQAEEQLKALQSDFEGLRSHLTCKICVRLLHQPYTTSCGHTYCYSCLCQWFGTNKARKTCPDCRTAVTQVPAPAYIIREMAAVFYSRPGLLPDGESMDQHIASQKEEEDIVQKDKDNQDPQIGGLFKGIFRERLPFQPRAIRDNADGVDRCPMCTWELEDGQCQQCGLIFDENGELAWEDSFAGFSDMDDVSERDLSSEDLSSEMDMGDAFGYDEAMDEWGDYDENDNGNVMLQRWIQHGIPPQAFRGPARRISHSEAGSRRSYSQSIISDMYADEMDTVEEEDEDGEDSSMNDFIDDEAQVASRTSRSASSTPSVTPQPPSNRARGMGRTRRVVEESESSNASTISSVIEEEEEEEDEEDQGPIRRGQRNRAQARLLNRANGRNNVPRRRTVPSSISTDASNEQELDEDTQALLREDGWMLQHDGPDEEMDEDEDDMSDGGQTTVGWDATAISNDRFRMGGSLTPTADRPRPNAPIRPPSRTGNTRFIDASRGLRRRSSTLSVSTQIEDGEADDDDSDLDQDGDVAMAMNSLRSRRSRAQLINHLAALNPRNNHNTRFLNRGFTQANPIDLDTDDNSDTSQPENHRYNPRISVLFADHQRALQEFQRPGALIDLEPRSTTPIARPRTANRNRPSPAPQYSPFNVPAPSRLRTPLMDNSSNSGARGLSSPPRRNIFPPNSPTTAGAQNAGSERSASVSSNSNASSVVLTPGSATPSSQQSATGGAQSHPAAVNDLIDRPPSRVARPPSATGRRTPAGGLAGFTPFSPVFPAFQHSNVGFNQAGRILQNQPLRNPWGAFVQQQQQQHGVRPRNSRPVLRDQSSTATLRPVASRVNIRDNANAQPGMRAQASRVDLRHQPSRRRLNNQASTRTLRASDHAQPPQRAVANAAVLNQPPPRPTRFTPEQRDELARELVNDRMRALGGTQQGPSSPVRTRNPFAPNFQRVNLDPAHLSVPAPPTGTRHVRSNSNDSVNSGHSSATAQGSPASPGLARRRSNRNMAAAPPPGVLPPVQGSFAPAPTTTYQNTYFRARQGSFTGSNSAYESPLSPNGRSPMVAATGQLI